MLRAHPEYRLAVAAVVVLLVLVAVAGWAVVVRGGRGEGPSAVETPPAPGAAEAGSGAGATPVPTSSAAPLGVPAPVIEAARAFTLAYVEYDYRSGPPNGEAVKPYSTPRLYWQLTQGGQDTAGNPAPWTAITIGSHEVVTASIVSAAGQLADANDASAQVVVSEHDTSTGGSWSGARQEDLGLVRSGPHWLVDQTSQVSPEHA